MRWVKGLFFFLLLFIGGMLCNIYVHELGHAITAGAYGGWQNNTVYFGATSYDEPEVISILFEWMAAQEWTAEDLEDSANVQALFIHLGQTSPIIRAGVIGGWAGQLILAFTIFLILQIPFIKTELGAYARLFLSNIVITAFAWLGGLWLFRGFLPTRSSDDTMLWQVLLGDNPVNILLFWVVALLCIGIAIWLGRHFGAWMFGSFSLTAVQGQKLGMIWAITIATASLVQILPSPIDFILILTLVGLIPTTYLARIQEKAQPNNQHKLVWFGTISTLLLLILTIITNSSIVINSAGIDTNQYRALQAYYCEQTDCLPNEYKAFFTEP